MQHYTGTYKPTDCPQNSPTLGHTIFWSPPNRVPDECVQGAKQKYFQTAPSPRPQHNTTQHNTTQHNTTRHNKKKNKNTAQNDTRKKPKTKQRMTQHNTTQRNTKGKQHNTTHNTYHVPIGRVNTAPTEPVKSIPPPPHVLCKHGPNTDLKSTPPPCLEAGSDPRGHLWVTWGVYLCAGKPPLADIILSHPPDLT